ncbi:MAG: isopentenyl-diphosphate delta-isomerase, partial [Eudoraea sp.]
LTEHELDHVLLGFYEDEPIINKEEVSEWKWMLPEKIKQDIIEYPENYTVWFKIIFEKFYDHLITNLASR